MAVRSQPQLRGVLLGLEDRAVPLPSSPRSCPHLAELMDLAALAVAGTHEPAGTRPGSQVGALSTARRGPPQRGRFRGIARPRKVTYLGPRARGPRGTRGGGT
jgi:hypothetical protein